METKKPNLVEAPLGRVLIVDDDQDTIDFCRVSFVKEGFIVDSASSLAQMREMVGQSFFDVVLLDLQLGEENGLDGLPFLLAESPISRVFVLTANASLDTAITALSNGATGYLTKETNPSEMLKQVKSHLGSLTRSASGESSSKLFSDLGFIGKSKAYYEMCATIEKLKDVDSTILLLGESGTGKEVIAKCLHALSPRSQYRFAALNCAAIPENLLESELFGHKKGSFTDAKNDRKGIFEICSQGSLLLDEIGDMPMMLQTKLLRVLQERAIVPVGSSTPIPINTRVIAATHRDPVEEIRSGRFREDLYFRLSVVPIHVPPLRHRKEDIPVLVNYFLNEFNTRFKKEISPPNNEVLKRLMAYDWPGNIRELRNTIERSVVLSSNGHLNIEDIFQHLQEKNPASTVVETPNTEGFAQYFNLSLTDAKQVFEKSYIEHHLKKSNGNIAEIARQTGRYRVDIYRLIEKYGIDQKKYR